MLKQFLKRRLPHGIKSATRNQLNEVSIFLKHRKGLKKAKKLTSSANLKLHLGCWPRLKEDWINIDLEDCSDITLDLREPLPFPNDSCSLIYSEHFLEHIDYPEPVTSLMKECLRVLQPGGVLSIVVPDLEMVFTSYVKGGTQEYYAAQKKIAS